MLSCEHVAARASALIDGDLSPWEALRLRMHLAVRRGCAGFAAQMKVTKSLTEAAVDGMRAAAADESGAAEILARYRELQRNGG